MAGEFFLPNFGAGPGSNYNFGLSPLQRPDLSMFSGWGGIGSPVAPGMVSPDQARLGQLNSQMQPSSILPWISAGIQGASTLGNLFLGFQGMNAARKDADWQRGMAENNYWNSVQSFNSNVEDRVRGRYSPGSAARNQDLINAELEKRRIGGG